MNKKVLAIAVAVLVVAVLATPLVGTAEACWFRRRWRHSAVYAKDVTVTDMGSYTEYVGTLGGANFVVRIPEDWNGMLVVGCHGYLLPWYADAQFHLDTTLNTAGIGLPFSLIEEGFAYAASSYGEGGYAVKKGMISTLQLTMYSLGILHWQYRRCHDIKVFLVGTSMGGTIALLLGEKYPKLYDGVLDICSAKNATASYKYIEWGLTLPLPPDFRLLCETMLADYEAACGGTPDEKPKAYERLSPVHNADITIPVITVHGALDPLIPLSFAMSYEIAVAQAGRSEYYRFYAVEDGGHCDPPMIDKALSCLGELVDYPVGW